MSEAITRLNAALEGRYAVERDIGEGGMATVYLADDLRHERKVALKVLKPELAAVVGAERFLAEIKTTANLQHPHVLPLFDSGEADGFLFYVMPYVEGETLRERIEREKQLPVGEAVKVAVAVANALQHAHDRGVIHRDIKPANILLQDGQPVVSDFGIALAVGSAGGARLTETGLSVGTPFYMAPEQATGDQHVGPSSDLYALAAVLYEMLTGDPPYLGSTAQAVLGQIISGESVSATKKRSSIPANVDAALRRGLEKLPADRFSSAQDFARALEDPSFRYGEVATAGARGGRFGILPVALAAALASLVTGVVVWGVASRGAEAVSAVGRFAVDLPGDGMLRPTTVQTLELTRDGRAAVFNVATFETGRQGSQLYLRRLDELEAVPIRGTDGVGSFFLDPSGEFVGFNDVSDNMFKKVPLTGGPPATIASTGVLSGGMRGQSWGDAGVIVYATASYPGLMSVPDIGGTPEPLTTPPEGSEEVHRDPHVLPGSELVLFDIVVPEQPTQIAVLSRETGEYRVLTNGAWPHYVEGDVLVFQRDDALWAAGFDAGQLALRTEPVPVLEGVETGSRYFSVSGQGTALYSRTSGTAGANVMVQVDRNGQERRLPVDPQDYVYPRYSPDGDRLAVSILDNGADLWAFDLGRGSWSRITFGGNNRFYPVWTPAGDRLTFADGTADPNVIYMVSSDGSGVIAPLLDVTGLQYPTSWSRDGRMLAFHEAHPENGRDLWVLPEGGEPEPFLLTPFQEWAATFSPDGGWLAYVSDKSGDREVYVRPYPGPGEEFTISTGGGTEPVWSPDGTELYYRSFEQMMAVTTNLRSGFSPEAPRPLWPDLYVRDTGGAAGTPNYDISPDGDSFLMVQGGASGANALVVILNWAEELKRVVGP